MRFSKDRPSLFDSLQRAYNAAYERSVNSVMLETSNDPSGALRSWRSTLECITVSLANIQQYSAPRTVTDQSLMSSILEIERQCRDRISVLEGRNYQNNSPYMKYPVDANVNYSNYVYSGTNIERTDRKPLNLMDELVQVFTPKPPIPPPRPPPPPPHRVSMQKVSQPPIPPNHSVKFVHRMDSTPMQPSSITSPSSSHPPPLPPKIPNNITSPIASIAAPSLLPRSSNVQSSMSHAKSDSSLVSSQASKSQPPSPVRRSPVKVIHTKSNSYSDGTTAGNSKTIMKAHSTTSVESPTTLPRKPMMKTLRNTKSEKNSNKTKAVHVASAAASLAFDRIHNNQNSSNGTTVGLEKLNLKRASNIVKPPSPNSKAKPKTTINGTANNVSADTAACQPQNARQATGRKSPIKISSATSESKVTSNSDKTPEMPNANRVKSEWDQRVEKVLRSLPQIEKDFADQIINEIVIQGDEVHWDDISGLEQAKNSLKETVVYPFLRPDLFSGLREPASGMLLFGPPGTGKTMLARAVATEAKSTFFSVSASSLTSKWVGESEKLVRTLFFLARKLAPSIIFVDEIDSLLSARSDSGESESGRRIKNEFLVHWSNLQHAAAGNEHDDLERVLVLGATNMPWSIDEAARRRFVRRQYIPLPERETRSNQLIKLLSRQSYKLTHEEVQKLIDLTDGFSGSDITALAKDAAMGPLRSLGEKLLTTATDEIRPIGFEDFVGSLKIVRPSVSGGSLKAYDDWAWSFGSSGA